LMPVSAEETINGDHSISYRNKERTISTSGVAADPDLVMLVRPRKSRIYFLRSFFDYPLSLSGKTLH